MQRARIERWLGKLYGVGRLALDPNLSAVLRKADSVGVPAASDARAATAAN